MNPYQTAPKGSSLIWVHIVDNQGNQKHKTKDFLNMEFDFKCGIENF